MFGSESRPSRRGDAGFAWGYMEHGGAHGGGALPSSVVRGSTAVPGDCRRVRLRRNYSVLLRRFERLSRGLEIDGWMDGLLSRALPYREMPRNGQNFHSIAQIALFEVIAVHQHSYNCDLAMLEVKYITTYSSTGNERGMGLVGLEGLEHTG